ncbi:GTPase Era [Treponema parvum]|uniref:GTPase Era n=1 Tax=Treponema parvum TaxID=138851 RepID=A0A975F2Q0_9SPIR|nr:GTPase Era [Treponema parvum]QTQ13296.1 GTPase Era [Treponema parvum]
MKKNLDTVSQEPCPLQPNEEHKTAVVAIIGRPSSGKSTFLNTACGAAVSIVSPVPQTTRNAIRGIVNTSLGQLVFIDTPGYHESEKKLNLKLKNTTEEQLKEAECILYIIDATRPCGSEEHLTSELVRPHAQKTVVAVNKTDDPKARPAVIRAFLSENLPQIPASKIFEISAKKDTGIDDVLKSLYSLAPNAPALYPKEFYTDQEVGFRISEVIRGEAINRLEEEIPHSIYVNIADMEMRKEGRELWVRAFLCVERESQKGIVIGKGASMIKTIRIESIKALRKIFDYRIDLDLQVKVDKNWRQKDMVLTKLLDK